MSHLAQTMAALVYEGPRQMVMRQVPIPQIASDEVLIRVVYSGICGSELSGYEGKNSLRQPPLIMGHEFSGHIEEIGSLAAGYRPELSIGMAVTANPLISCNRCGYCLRGLHQLCPNRKLLSASLPGSNAQYVAVRCDAVYPVPHELSLTDAALVEPAACAVHAAALASPSPDDRGLVVGAGPIGLLTIQALADRGLKTIYCADLNPQRLQIAQDIGAIPATFDDLANDPVDIALDAVGASAVRQGCVRVTRAGGKIIWIGLHDAESSLPVNDLVRREVTTIGAFAYRPHDFKNALQSLAQKRFQLKSEWTRIEPLENGAACFEELLRGASVAKIWLTPQPAE